MAYNLFEMIPVYKIEQDYGLAEAIQKNSTLAYCSVAKPKSLKINYDEFMAKARRANPNQPDLYYLDSILVSVGWNKNDDIFTPDMVWAAKDTPVDKKFNYMHDEKDIIGHMTESFAIDKDGNLLDTSLSLDELPSEYDIVVASVLYKTWSDEKLQERMDSIIDQIPNGDWFVSMECLFSGFDYGLVEDGQSKVIQRNQSTAFLTKYLRAYGGDGYFDGKKIGRVLRNFVFSGKGLVDKPANEASIIFTKNNPFVLGSTETSVAMEKDMADVNDKAVERLEARVKELETEKRTLEDTIRAEAEKAHASELQSLNDEIKSLKDEVTAKSEEIETKNTELTQANEKLAEAEKLNKELTDNIAKAEAEKVKVGRISQLVEANVPKDEAEKVVDKWSGASDEQFVDIVELHAAKFMKKDKAEKKDDEEETKASEVEDTLEEVQEETSASDNLETNDDNEELHQAVASWCEGLFNNKKRSLINGT